MDDTDFTPAAPRFRHDGWTPSKQRVFIRTLAASGSVRTACRHPLVEMSPATAYALRAHKTGADFARAWDAALGAGMATLQDEAFEAAMHGRQEDVWYKGEIVGQRFVRNDRLLMFMLANRALMANRNYSVDGLPGMAKSADAVFAAALATFEKRLAAAAAPAANPAPAVDFTPPSWPER